MQTAQQLVQISSITNSLVTDFIQDPIQVIMFIAVLLETYSFMRKESDNFAF